jgi:UDP-GlcNAc:undecaprenyl-phosphate GlcNAc-1-phosphate transferase
MNFNIILDYLILSAFVSLAVNYMARNIARRNELLVDLPDKSRKFHKRPTPLTGGIAIFISLLISGKIYIDLNELNDFIPLFSAMLFVASFFIIIVFLIDDIRGIKPAYRLIAQCIAAYFVIYSTGIYLESLGNLFGFGEINLGVYGIPITIFCVVGVMNAFNMIDGINGLCAGSALVMLLFTGIASGFIYDSMLVLLIGSMIGFLAFNLRIVGKKKGCIFRRSRIKFYWLYRGLGSYPLFTNGNIFHKSNNNCLVYSHSFFRLYWFNNFKNAKREKLGSSR